VGGDPYVILMNTIIFTFQNKNYIPMISKNHEENGYGHDLVLLIILHTVVHILRKVGAERKMIQITHMYLHEKTNDVTQGQLAV
jgi:hypothetical protein